MDTLALGILVVLEKKKRGSRERTAADNIDIVNPSKTTLCIHESSCLTLIVSAACHDHMNSTTGARHNDGYCSLFHNKAPPAESPRQATWVLHPYGRTQIACKDVKKRRRCAVARRGGPPGPKSTRTVLRSYNSGRQSRPRDRIARLKPAFISFVKEYLATSLAMTHKQHLTRGAASVPDQIRRTKGHQSILS